MSPLARTCLALPVPRPLCASPCMRTRARTPLDPPPHRTSFLRWCAFCPRVQQSPPDPPLDSSRAVDTPRSELSDSPPSDVGGARSPQRAQSGSSPIRDEEAGHGKHDDGKGGGAAAGPGGSNAVLVGVVFLTVFSLGALVLLYFMQQAAMAAGGAAGGGGGGVVTRPFWCGGGVGRAASGSDGSLSPLPLTLRSSGFPVRGSVRAPRAPPGPRSSGPGCLAPCPEPVLPTSATVGGEDTSSPAQHRA